MARPASEPIVWRAGLLGSWPCFPFPAPGGGGHVPDPSASVFRGFSRRGCSGDVMP